MKRNADTEFSATMNEANAFARSLKRISALETCLRRVRAMVSDARADVYPCGPEWDALSKDILSELSKVGV